MALDVRLCREEDEDWGFELFGGADEEMPLTIEKIQPDSPAKRAGLLNGDTVLTINGEEAINWPLEVACKKIARSGDNLTVGVMRGLYDPVLDDYEPIYDYEPEGLDQPSEPTEVPFKIQTFVEPSDLGSSLLNHELSPATDGFIPLTNGTTESRSLTASPFVGPTKPYRPFSTEPLPEIPSLEDPIILNPNYRDQFGKSPIDTDPDYILNAHCKNELNGFQGFKLPISDQYDPDGTRFVQNVEITDKLLKYERHVKCLDRDLEVTKEIKVVDSVCRDVKESTSSDVRKETISQDVKIKGMSQEDVKTETKDTKVTEKISSEFVRKDFQSEKKEMFKEEIEEKAIREEMQYIEKMRQDIDLEKIEETALSVVEDSIEKAVSVAEEIKKEMEEEIKSSEITQVSETEMKDVSKSTKVEKSEMSDATEIHETKTERKISKVEDIESKVDKRVSREETVEVVDDSQKYARKEFKEEISERCETVDSKVASYISEEHEEAIQKPMRNESVYSYGSKVENKGEYKNVTESVSSGVKTGAEQRAYAIGVQTIPNIRGVVHSCHQIDQLLRTFFIHLTDVMVALSRFVLAQPLLNETCMCSHRSTETVQKSSQQVFESQKVEKRAEQSKMKVEARQEVKEVVKPVPVKKQEVKAVAQKIEKGMKVESIQEKMEEVKPVVVKEAKQETQQAKLEEVELDKKDFKEEVKVQKVEAKQAEKVKKEVIEVQKVETKQAEKIEKAVEVSEKKAVTGAEMAQRTEKKLSQDMTQKMDAVISEFQTIAVEDVKEEMLQRSRRSRSRSQIEEEVMKEGDPLEWLSKVDSVKTSQERMEISKSEMSKKEFTSQETMQMMEKIETKHETKHKMPKSPKQTYIAIVESHVFTNKDAIFEEQVTDFSETSSVQSAEEINTAFEAIETSTTENVALENAIRELETAKVVEESHELDMVTAKSTETLQKMEEITHESKELKQEEFKKETAVKSSEIQEVLIEETKQIVEPVIEIKQTKLDKTAKVAVDINESLSVAESTEISILESKTELSKIDMKEESVAVVEEAREDKVVETKTKVIEPKPVQIEEINESVTIKLDKKDEIPVHDEFAALKIIKKVEAEGTLSPEIIEIEDISEDLSTANTLISQSAAIATLEMDSSKHVTQSSMVSSKIGMSKSEAASIEIDSSTHVSEASIVSSKMDTAKSEATSIVGISKSSQKPSEIDISSSSTHTAISKHLMSKVKASQDIVQESSFTARSVDKKLTLNTNLERQISGPPSTIDTPTPATVPPTPLTDEYVFKLTLPLPKSSDATPVPRDCTPTPEDEDPHIVKKKLIPHIETSIGEKVIFDPPLPTPPVDKVQSPVYTKPGLNGGGIKRWPVYRKPGLFGGADRPEYTKEEIREIERKSTLLASAIDETIKSIEEYKEEVGLETKKEVKRKKESYRAEVSVESHQNGLEEIETQIAEIVKECDALEAIQNGKPDSIITEYETNEEEPETVVIALRKRSIEDTKETINSNKTVDIEAKTEDITNGFQEAITAVEVNLIQDDVLETKEQEMSTAVAFESTIKEQPIEEEKREMQVKLAPVISELKEKISKTENVEEKSERSDALPGFRPVVFDPEAIKRTREFPFAAQEPLPPQVPRQSPYMTEGGEIIGTMQGIVDGLEEPVMDAEEAKELGRPGISEEKIAELISGEAEMLREAHVMGLSRVLKSHMHRPDDSSVDFQKIKPMLNSLKDSEVLKALNEEILRQKEEERKKEEKKWTTFLQKPKRPVPKAKFGYHGWTEEEKIITESYKVKIVKQAKPKVAPDYKPEDFDTGPLPWEERAKNEPIPSVEPEEPILIPEVPEFLEAVDPLQESEVPDLEDTGIPLPPKTPSPQPVEEEPSQPEPTPEDVPLQNGVKEAEEVQEEGEEKKETQEEMDNRLAEQLVRSVQSMVDPNASVEQQLAQMRAQLAALAQLPEVIQQSLAMVSQQLNKMTQKEGHMEITASHNESHSYQHMEVSQHHSEMQTITEANEPQENGVDINNNDSNQNESDKMTIEEIVEEKENTKEEEMVQEENRMVEQKEHSRMLVTPVTVMTEEEMKLEKQKKEQARLDHEARQIKHNPTPRATKPKRVFGPLDPEDRPAVVLPGGRRWRKTEDVYNEARIAETLQAQAELIQGKAMGINFKKYEKPPVSLDHLKHSEVYKLVHDMDQAPLKRVEMRTPVIAEADYRERCRSMTPSAQKHMQIPQQFHP